LAVSTEPRHSRLTHAARSPTRFRRGPTIESSTQAGNFRGEEEPRLERLELALGLALLAFQDGDALSGGVELGLDLGQLILQGRDVLLCAGNPCRILDLLDAGVEGLVRILPQGQFKPLDEGGLEAVRREAAAGELLLNYFTFILGIFFMVVVEILVLCQLNCGNNSALFHLVRTFPVSPCGS